MEVKVSYNGGSKWRTKLKGVIYVEKEEHIDVLYDLLLKQDEYWDKHKEVIKRWTPLKTWREVFADSVYVGKTDIYEVEELRKIIPFIFFQFDDLGCVEENH